jgi:propionyl-CoA carboxylase alpha chain
MKYVVMLDGQSIDVDVDGDRVTVGGRTLTATLDAIPGTPLRQLLVDGRSLTLSIGALGRGRWSLSDRGERWDLEVVDERTRHVRSLTAGSDLPRGPSVLKAPMPGLVVRVEVESGAQVGAGVPLVVLEAMKMENELKAGAPGRVKSVKVRAGEAVEKGQVLVEFEADSTST